ncbi:MAG: hypothetical protein DCC52_11195 [Chloroflexi bacterium]|nr:MAG: hypothetical protein DCC52_11195 [Chloroflexota bacterium]
MPHVDGVLVGTSLKANGRVGNPVALERVQAIVQRVRAFAAP